MLERTCLTSVVAAFAERNILAEDAVTPSNSRRVRGLSRLLAP